MIPALTLRRAFVADHFHDLPGFQEARHGHNWSVEAEVFWQSPEEEARLAACLDAWVRTVDYTLLNQQPQLAGRNPTAEVLAQWVFELLATQGFRPRRVRIREKAHYWAGVEAKA